MAKEIDNLLEAYLTYKSDEGCFYWKISPAHGIKIGDRAGYYNSRYAYLHFKGQRYFIHKLVWYKENGEYPKEQIDHIDQNTKNNHISNLRIVSAQDNAKNKPKRRDNTSGITGISWDKQTNKWVVRIKNNQEKYVNRGRFNTISEAKQERDRALVEFGYHSNHGIRLSQLQYRKQ